MSTGTLVTPEELKRINEDVRSIYAAYPKWMDKADAIKTYKFKRHVRQAIKLIKQKSRDHQWIVNARSLLRDHTELYWSLHP